MGSGKNSSNSETSSEEIDQPEKLDLMSSSDHDNVGIGRSYECTFCKRGFTNAQALGGHMNIHRKDKAKAKQIKNHHQVIKKSHEDNYVMSTSPKFLAPNLHVQQPYSTAMAAYMSYQLYSPSSNNNSYMNGNDQYHDLTSPRSEYHMMDQSLSLRIGPAPAMEENGVGDHVERNMNDIGRSESELDLELRLGHYPN